MECKENPKHPLPGVQGRGTTSTRPRQSEECILQTWQLMTKKTPELFTDRSQITMADMFGFVNIDL
jgi:hypothetical protein